MGKGLSKDEKAQKLALQHWLEAVSCFLHFYVKLYDNAKWALFYFILLQHGSNGRTSVRKLTMLFCHAYIYIYRLIHVIDMVIICTFTMMSGSKARAASLFSTGKCFLKLLSGNSFFYKKNE